MKKLFCILTCMFVSSAAWCAAPVVPNRLNLAIGDTYQINTYTEQETTDKDKLKENVTFNRKKQIYTFTVKAKEPNGNYRLEFAHTYLSDIVLQKNHKNDARWETLYVYYSNIPSNSEPALFIPINQLFDVILSPSAEVLDIQVDDTVKDVQKDALKKQLQQLFTRLPKPLKSKAQWKDSLYNYTVRDVAVDGYVSVAASSLQPTAENSAKRTLQLNPLTGLVNYATSVTEQTMNCPYEGCFSKNLQVIINEETKLIKLNNTPFYVWCNYEIDQPELLKTMPTTNVVLEGEIKNAPDTLTSISILQKQLFPVTKETYMRVDLREGKFKFRLFIDKGEDIKLYLGSLRPVALFLEPGDSVQMTIDAKTYPQQIRYAGIGAENCNYSQQFDEQFGLGRNLEMYEGMNLERMKQLSFDTYSKWIDSMFKPQFDFFSANHNQLTLSYVAVAYHNLLFEALSAKQRQLLYYKKPNNFYEGVDMYNPLYAENEKYLDFLRVYQLFILPNELNRRMGFQDANFFDNDYNLGSASLLGQTRYEFLARQVVEAYENESENAISHGDRLFARFKDDYPGTAHITQLNEFYKEQVLLAPGQPAPQFTLKDPEGRNVSLSDFKGKVVVLDFWDSYCGNCINIFDNFLPEFKARFEGKDVVFINVCADKSESLWKSTLGKHTILGINVLDKPGRLTCQAYQVNNVFPRYVVINKEGKMVNKQAPNPGGAGLGEMIEKELAK